MAAISAAAAAAAASLLRFPLTRLSSRLLLSYSSRSSPLHPPRLHLHLHSSPHRLHSSLLDLPRHLQEDNDDDDDAGDEDEDEDEDLDLSISSSSSSSPAPAPAAEKEEEDKGLVLQRLPRPKLSMKERKELASYAHGLGKKLSSQQVGKGGVTPSVAAAFVENLERNELLKLKIHGNCPGELSDVIMQLEESTGSIAVDQIGHSVILYRPSISKMKKREEQSASNARNPRFTKSASTFRPQKRRPVSKGSSYKRG